jgi:hypothetical protein
MKLPPVIRKTTAVFHQSGALQVGKGKITGIIALTLGGLAVLAVLAFHLPEYLTTPDLRKKYDVGLLRQVLLVGMVIAGGMAIANLVQRRNRWLNATALGLIALAAAMGGHRVPVADFPDNTPYIGLDWFILDLLGSSMIFILIEKLVTLHRDQPVFRPGWQTDFTHFIVNHLLVGLALLIVNFVIHRLFGWMVSPRSSSSCWWPTWCSTGPTAPITRSRSCGASTRFITVPNTWTGWRARAFMSSNS